MTERAIAWHYHATARRLRRRLPPITVRFRYHRDCLARVEFWPLGFYSSESDRTRYGPRVRLDIDPMFRRRRNGRLAIRILLHEVGHVLQALEHPHWGKELEHGRSFKRAMRRLVRCGAMDANLW